MAATIREHRFTNREAASAALAKDLVRRLNAAVTHAGAASLILSGGSSPEQTIRLLGDADVDWSRTKITLSDERWVASDHELSNEGMLKRLLFNGPAKASEFVSLYADRPSPGQACVEIEQRLGVLSRPFTATLLGMGNDGHTASLFPQSNELASALRSDRLCAAITGEQLDPPRISLTPRALLDSEAVFLLLFGADKLAVYEAARAGSDPQEYPVRAILHQQQVPIDMYWAA